MVSEPGFPTLRVYRSLLHRPALLVAAAAFFLLGPQPSRAVDAEDLGALLGFTIIASAAVKGDHAGSRPGMPVELDNGMIFEFSTGFSTYAHRPRAIVFAKAASNTESPGPADRAGPSTIYTLLIENKLYAARRLR